ncbi:MAG: polymorphic toxin-type HINT domain-containing protein [Pirellula sp.]|nr:polymorphic toxin-type HINT domain-containing protein [Pirellula sp.]
MFLASDKGNRAEIVGSDGKIEVIEGTPIHPIWSVDRNDWVPLSNLVEGETLHSSRGIATILSLALVTCSLPVYNIEVNGEHVYQVGEMGVLVHNTYADTFFRAFPDLKGAVWVHHRIEQQVLSKYPGLFTRTEIDDISNLVGIPTVVNSRIHLGLIRRAWNRFYNNYPYASRDDIQHFARVVDEWILKEVGLP